MTSLRTLVQASQAILLDFDGPVCRLFSGLPAPEIAEKIRSFLLDHRTSLPESMMSENDPLALLGWTGRAAPHLLPEVEQIQSDAELTAAHSAEPTLGITKILHAATALDLPVVIVTNNSAEAVEAFLGHHLLSSSVTGIAARVRGRPDLMKPDAHLVLRGVEIAGKPAAACLLIGDSPTDMQAGIKAGVRCVGYAKRPPKVTELSEAGADLVVQSMESVADVVTSLRA